MRKSTKRTKNLGDVVDNYLKHSVDNLVDMLERKYDCELSDSTKIWLVSLTHEYISRMVDKIGNEELVEPEEFERPNYL